MEALRINHERLWQSLMDMAKIGATPRGGVCRVALTDVDLQGRDLFVRWAREAGCEVEIDQMGNIFARRPGTDNTLPPVLTGSHLDTQPTGGYLDGVYGVLAGRPGNMSKKSAFHAFLLGCECMLSDEQSIPC